MKFMKVLIIILFSIATLISPQENDSIQKRVDELQESKLFKNSQWCLYAEYLDDSMVILDHNSHLSVAPASGLKVFTSIVALDKLGEDYRFETEIYFDGLINDTVLNGDVYLVGGGDPSLGSDLVNGAYDMNELKKVLIETFKKYFIKKVTGSIIVDNSLYEIQPIPDNWEYIDVGNYYGASSTALSITNNLYYLYFEPGKNVGDIAKILRTEPEIPGLTFINHMKTGEEGSGDNGYIYCPPLHFEALLQGSIPKGKPQFSIKGSIPDPPLFAAQWVKQTLSENGIQVLGQAQKTQTEIDYRDSQLAAIIKSPPLKDIVYVLNKRSSNLFAEMLLKAVALKVKGEGKTGAGTTVVKEFIRNEGIDADGLRMYDGSGLSRVNSITAKMMVDLLKLVTKKEYYNSFYNSLGIFGKPDDIGFFRNVGKGTAIANNARVKSGVIQGVRSYSGYVRDKNGRTIVYSMIANNFNGSGGSVSKIHRELITDLANLK